MQTPGVDAALALWIKNVRRRAGFTTQAALADALGVERSAVGNWESGRGKPSMAHAERFAVVTRRKRSEVLARFGYPVGGGEPEPTAVPVLPVEWQRAISEAVATGIREGVAQALDEIRREGHEGSEQADGGSRPRRSA